MNILSKALLFICCILAFTTMLFFFQFVAVRTYNANLLAQKEAFSLEAEKRTRLAETHSSQKITAEKIAEEARLDAIENHLVASELQAELERRIAENEVAHQENAALLSARIERESAARSKAEREAEKFKSQKESVEQDMIIYWEETEKRIAELNAKIKKLNDTANAEKLELQNEILNLKSELLKTKTELARLTENNSNEAKASENANQSQPKQ